MSVIPFRDREGRKPTHHSLAVELALKLRRNPCTAKEERRILLTIIAMQEDHLTEFIRFDRAQRKATKLKERGALIKSKPCK